MRLYDNIQSSTQTLRWKADLLHMHSSASKWLIDMRELWIWHKNVRITHVLNHTHRDTWQETSLKKKKNRLITVRKNNVHTLALTDELAMNLKWTLGLSIFVIFQCKYLNIPKSRHNYLRFKILSLAFWKIIEIKQEKYLSVGKKEWI